MLGGSGDDIRRGRPHLDADQQPTPTQRDDARETLERRRAARRSWHGHQSSSSSSIISTTAHAAAHDTGFPPKVEPWSPARTEPAAASADEKRSDRKAVRKALGERHEVWPHAELLEGEERPGAPDPGLNLVEAEKRRQSRCRLDELVLERNHSALAEYRLEQNQPDLVVDGCDECTDVVRLDEANAGHEWDEWLALRRLPGCRQRAERPAVEATLESNDTESSGCLACVLRAPLRWTRRPSCRRTPERRRSVRTGETRAARPAVSDRGSTHARDARAAPALRPAGRGGGARATPPAMPPPKSRYARPSASHTREPSPRTSTMSARA